MWLCEGADDDWHKRMRRLLPVQQRLYERIHEAERPE